MDAFGKSAFIQVEGNGIGRWVGKICEEIMHLENECGGCQGADANRGIPFF